MLSDIVVVLENKMRALAVASSISTDILSRLTSALNKGIDDNNAKAANLNDTVKTSDEERKNLQRKACSIFETDFTIRNWPEIAQLKLLTQLVVTKTAELDAIERASPSKDARSRVAATFKLLLHSFFADKYVFEESDFTLKRGDRPMSRCAHRTLSDGEKTAIAFCYFLACVHRKVGANSDYRKFFLVFDDPVTSMSYDYVFSIAQTLKNLSISKTGEVSVNPALIDGDKYARPELLVLTHSSYFFNVALTNKLTKDDATFALHPEKGTHKLTSMKNYVAPFDEQLKNIYAVSNGTRDPDHSTGNEIRSVLEAIGRFCRPDKSASLTDFIRHIAGEDGIVVKSVLINAMSHGSYYAETPAPDDLKLACGETLEVVKKYAVVCPLRSGPP